MILLLAHGSNDERHLAGIERLAAEVAAVAPEVTVGHAFFDFHGPDLLSAVEHLGEGEEVRVLPLLMSAGVHLLDDVPAAVRAAQSDRSDLVWRLLPPLPAVRFSGVVMNYLRTRPGIGGRELVLVAAGSTRAGALAGIDELAATLQVSTAVRVRVANGLRDPGLERRPATRRAGTWLPVMYADGRLLDSLRAHAEDCGADVLPPVGSLPGVAAQLVTWSALDPIELGDSDSTPG